MYKSGLVELEAVVAIARHGSFRAAALDLDMSPTAIGNAVASLEKRLGVRLFNRTTRNVALTSAGREYVEAIASSRTAGSVRLSIRTRLSLHVYA
jgi:DNA-binding transcriptional LysR family regulator